MNRTNIYYLYRAVARRDLPHCRKQSVKVRRALLQSVLVLVSRETDVLKEAARRGWEKTRERGDRQAEGEQIGSCSFLAKERRQRGAVMM